MDFLFEIVSKKGESLNLSNKNKLPRYDFDPIVLMGVMKKWLIQI
jgi:hypothetical protein